MYRCVRQYLPKGLVVHGRAFWAISLNGMSKIDCLNRPNCTSSPGLLPKAPKNAGFEALTVRSCLPFPSSTSKISISKLRAPKHCHPLGLDATAEIANTF